MIIGITGHAQHGKDTTGRYLVERYGFHRYAFADQLKSMALVLDPLVNSEEWGEHVRLSRMVDYGGWDEAKKDPEVRRFLQVLGTEAVRDHLGQDSWVEALALKMEQDKVASRIAAPVVDWVPLTFFEDVVVTDVRFHNEADAIRRWSGALWRVERPGFDNGLGTDHPSEKYVDEIIPDVTFSATSVEELLQKIDDHMRRKS